MAQTMAYQILPQRSPQRYAQNVLAYLYYRLFSLQRPEDDARAMQARLIADAKTRGGDGGIGELLLGVTEGLAFIAHLRQDYATRIAALVASMDPSAAELSKTQATRRAEHYGAYFMFGSRPFDTSELRHGMARLAKRCGISNEILDALFALIDEGWLVEAHVRHDHGDSQLMPADGGSFKVEHQVRGHYGAYWHPKEIEEWVAQGCPLAGCQTCGNVSALYDVQTERFFYTVCWGCMNRISRGAPIANCDVCGHPFVAEGEPPRLVCVPCHMQRVSLG